jgi:hypothetical protein
MFPERCPWHGTASALPSMMEFKRRRSGISLSLLMPRLDSTAQREQSPQQWNQAEQTKCCRKQAQSKAWQLSISYAPITWELKCL